MADVVIPFVGDPITGDPANLSTSTDTLSRTPSLPTNMVRLYLDVLAESQGGDETFQINDAVYSQVIAQTSTVATVVATRHGGTTTIDRFSLSYALNLAYVFDNNANTQDTTTSQDFTNVASRAVDGRTVFDSSFENAIDVKSGLVFDINGAATRVGEAGTQSITYSGSIGSCYKRSVTTALNALVSSVEGSGCAGGNVLDWLAQPDGSPVQGVLERLTTK